MDSENLELVALLKSEKINTLKDVKNLTIGGSIGFDAAQRDQFSHQFISSADYPWAKDLYFLVHKLYDKTLNKHKEWGSQGIVVGEPYSSFGFHSWKFGDPLFGMRAKLSCLFPNRVLLLSDKFLFNEDDGSYWIPVDFLMQAVEMYPLLIGGFALLLPKRLVEQDPFGINTEIVGSYYYRKEGNCISVPNSGYGMEDLVRQTRNFDKPLDFLLNLPWLFTKDVRHCVDIMEKHSREFSIYSNAVTNALSSRDPAVLQKWVQEVENSSREIEVIYENRRKELKAKGWETLAGFLPSALALALPDSDVKRVLAPLVASKTIVDGARWFYDMRQAKNLISKEKNWLIWRMKH